MTDERRGHEELSILHFDHGSRKDLLRDDLHLPSLQISRAGLSAPVYIYGYVDPHTPEECAHAGAVRYIGKSTNPTEELHRRMVRPPIQYPLGKWLTKLQQQNLVPSLVVLAIAESDGWREAERRWIGRFRDSGTPLLNILNGGQGFDSVGASRASKIGWARLSFRQAFLARQIGVPKPLVSAKLSGRVLSAETRSKMSAARKGVPKSKEWCTKVAAALRGKKLSPLHYEKTVRGLARARQKAVANRAFCALFRESFQFRVN